MIADGYTILLLPSVLPCSYYNSASLSSCVPVVSVRADIPSAAVVLSGGCARTLLERNWVSAAQRGFEVCNWGKCGRVGLDEGCKCQPKLNQTKLKRAEHRQRCELQAGDGEVVAAGGC